MQLSFRLDKRPGESHLALDGKKFDKDGQHAGGAGDLESATGSPRSCNSVGLAKALRFVKAVLVLTKRSLEQSHSGRTHIGFLDSKNFVSRATCKVPQCQKWDCHALLLFTLDRAIPRSRFDQKRARQILSYKLHSELKTSKTSKISNALSARLKLKTSKISNNILRILRFLAESGRHNKLFDLFDVHF